MPGPSKSLICLGFFCFPERRRIVRWDESGINSFTTARPPGYQQRLGIALIAGDMSMLTDSTCLAGQPFFADSAAIVWTALALAPR